MERDDHRQYVQKLDEGENVNQEGRVRSESGQIDEFTADAAVEESLYNKEEAEEDGEHVMPPPCPPPSPLDTLGEQMLFQSACIEDDRENPTPSPYHVGQSPSIGQVADRHLRNPSDLDAFLGYNGRWKDHGNARHGNSKRVEC